jgi:hypothetical protein
MGGAGRLQQLGEAVQELDQPIDPRWAVERRTLPIAVEITPLDQFPPGAPQSIDGAVAAIRLSAKTAERGTAERALDAFRWIGKLALQPVVERFVVQACRLGFGQNVKQRIDPRFYRTLPEQIRAKTVNGADLGFFEPAERAVEPVALRGSAFGCRSCPFERLAQTKLELAGGLFREGHGDDPSHFGPAGLDDPDDAAHQLGGFAGAGGGFDNQSLIERRGDLLAILSIDKGCAHGRFLNSSRSAIWSRDLRRARRS